LLIGGRSQMRINILNKREGKGDQLIKESGKI